nr:MAG TPA: hypothetical protein [Caudoviricetes sp.]
MVSTKFGRVVSTKFGRVVLAIFYNFRKNY